MTNQKKFFVVNSFADKQFCGNPAAVFTDAEGIDESKLQLIAKQLNLVETVFVYSSKEEDIDFEFRYFTPTEELNIAGHPTVAAVIALIKDNKIILDEHEKNFYIKTKDGKKQINITQNDNNPIVKMKQSDPKFYNILDQKDKVAEVLGISTEDILNDLPIQPVNTGLGHLIVPVKSIQALMNIKRNIKPLKDLCNGVGMREVQAFTFDTYNSECNIHTRNICPREGIEDPGCGIGNSALGAYLLKNKYANSSYINIKAEQGNIVNMPCIIETSVMKKEDNSNLCSESMDIFIGGSGVIMVEGKFYY